LGELTTAQVFFHHRAIDVSYAGGFQGLDPDLRRRAVTVRQRAVAITTVRPRDEFAVPGFLHPSATGAFGHLGALVLGDHPWHLRAQFAVRTVAKRILEQAQRRVHLLERLAQEPLMRLGTGEPIRRPDDHGIELAAPGRVTQTVQGRAVQPCPAEAIIDIFRRWQPRPTVVLHVLLAQAPLTLDGAFVWLRTGRASSIECSVPRGPPGVPA